MSAASRHPPAFQVEIVTTLRVQVLVAVLAALSSLAFVAALATHWPACAWLLPVLLPASVWLGGRLARSEPRCLQWDGQVWRLAPAQRREPGAAVRIEVLMDFGDWLLLRASVPGTLLPRRHYLPLGRSTVGPTWGALRATLYSARAEPLEQQHPG